MRPLPVAEPVDRRRALEPTPRRADATAEPTPTEEPGLRLPSPLASDPTAITYKITVEVEAGESGSSS